MQTYAARKMTQYDCTSVKILKASLSFSSCLRTVCFFGGIFRNSDNRRDLCFPRNELCKNHVHGWLMYQSRSCIPVFLFFLGKNRHLFFYILLCLIDTFKVGPVYF